MDDKEFRKLHREDLIEIIYQYQRREQRLLQENAALRSQLEDRRIRMAKTGSIAEASLALSGIFEAAQKAVDYYIESAKANAAVENPGKPQEPQLSKAPQQMRKPAPQPQDSQLPGTPEVSVPMQKPAAAGIPAVRKPTEKKAASAPAEVQAVPQPPTENPAREEKRRNLPFLQRTGNAQPANRQMPEKQTVKPEEKKEKLQPERKNSQVQASKMIQKQPEGRKPETKIPEVPQPKTETMKPTVEIPEIPLTQPVKAGAPAEKHPASGKQPAPQKNQGPGPLEKPAKAPDSPKTSGEKPGGNGIDTDAFIASLKDYLGM